MTVRRWYVRSFCFAAAYAMALFIGRHGALDASGVGLIWPASGVTAAWFCAQRGGPTRRLDMVLLPCTLAVLGAVSGLETRLIPCYALAALVQPLVFAALIGRWAPHLWGAGGTAPLGSPRDLRSLLGAALCASAVSAATASGSVWLVSGHFPASEGALFFARNSTSMLLIGAAAILVGSAIARSRVREDWAALRQARPWRLVEGAAILIGSTVACLFVFTYDEQLPLSFALLGGTVLVGTRLPTPFVLLHSPVVTAIAVRSTIDGSGPFVVLDEAVEQSVVVQFFGMAVAVVGLTLALGRDERDALLAALDREKADLADQREQAAHQAGLLLTIIDSMGDGLAVIDADGETILRNPAATRLLGETYQLFHLDGSRYADKDWVFRKALQGEEVRGIDLAVRNPGVTQPRIVRVNATPLPGTDGRASAVVLFADVTAERRHRDELTNFAGVVAHDLLNPLSSVDGWASAALESLEVVPAHPGIDDTRDDLGRLTRASARMRGLIDGLLAYTTAREASVEPERVELAEIVGDIVSARTDAAAAAGKPQPRFTVGALPPVEADPVLVRQLVDNLIGNAVKYTAPGVTPALTITAEPAGEQVTIRIADNGIGIPEGQHEAIFDNFHRAHAGGAYLGTGLGLAICQRIVERHGGTISAADNPGGGSCFTFTLPIAAAHQMAA
ncbi:ATP-binding protein [Actinoplanes sp. CA-015351]|uniref:ATP-binding protein n=1 Tax=Actinoplanes sp. CA-015351 TaxID=3239897 RepID=UPI003D980767